MLRAVILSLILFVAFGTLVPISTEYSEASVVSSQRKYKKKKRAEKYRRMAMRQNRKKQNTSKQQVAKNSGKSKIKPRKKARRATQRYKAKRKSRVRKTVRKKRAVRRSKSKRRAKRSTRVRRKAKRSTRRSRASKRRYTAKRKKRSTKRRVARKRSSVRRAKTRRASVRRVNRKRSGRKYSKKWWANYRAQQRRKKAVASRKRANRLKTIRLAKKKEANSTPSSVRYERLATANAAPAAVRTQAQMPAAAAQMQMVSGDVSMDVVGTATGETVTRGRNTAVGGVSTVQLRRTVIDQMIRESGWVENEFQKEVDGKKVYVVVAKAPDKNNRIQAKTYYFTESNGRIYRVAASSSNESTEAAQKRSEDMIRTLDSAARPQQAQNQ